MQNIIKSGIITVLKDNFLLVKSKHSGKYVFPKGYIRKNETILQAALRETLEEAGATVIRNSLKVFCTYKGVFWYQGVVETVSENREGRIVIAIDYEAFNQRIDEMGNNTIFLVNEYRRRQIVNK